MVFFARECWIPTDPQFIFVELIEQLIDSAMIASEVNLWLVDTILPFTGQFSVIEISPLKKKLKFSIKKFPEEKVELVIVLSISHDLPIICTFWLNSVVGLERTDINV